MTPEQTQSEQRPEERTERSGRRPGELGSLDVWARSSPIRLAGYELLKILEVETEESR